MNIIKDERCDGCTAKLYPSISHCRPTRAMWCQRARESIARRSFNRPPNLHLVSLMLTEAGWGPEVAAECRRMSEHHRKIGDTTGRAEALALAAELAERWDKVYVDGEIIEETVTRFLKDRLSEG